MSDTKTYDIDDDRLASYLDAVADRIGYALSRSASSTGTSYRMALRQELDIETETVGTVTRDWAGMGGDTEVEIHAYESPHDDETKYVAEWTARTSIDDYIVTDLVFHGRPSADDIRTAELADQVARKVRDGMDVTFSCWECGTDTHVLDAAGASAADTDLPKLRRVVDAGEARYCSEC